MGEHDKTIILFTRDEGLVRAVVKGARKPMSKLSSVTQPYTRAFFQLYRGRSMDRVTQVSLRTTHPGMAAEYGKMVYAGFLCELVSGVVPEREKNEGLFDFFSRVLRNLEERDDPWPVATWGALGVLARAGFAPSFSECAACGAPVSGDALFSAEDGGLLCLKCGSKPAEREGSISVSAGTVRLLDMLAQSSAKDADCPSLNARGRVREEALSVLLRYIQGVLGRRPKSASLVESIEVEKRLKE